ncbi:MAG: DNA polymerase III subunit delta [Clostridia bacterium]|nr:DNA polymerase III subunit delta [Clostridia bacterium]
MTYNEFKEQLQNEKIGADNLAPCYFVTGTDEYVFDQMVLALKEYVDRDFRDMNYSEYSEDEISDAVYSLSTFPMFTDKRMVVLTLNKPSRVKEEEEAQGGGDALEKEKTKVPDLIDSYLDNPLDSTIFVINAMANPQFKLKSRNIEKVKADFDSDADRFREMDRIVSKEPRRIMGPRAATELAKRTQNDMYRIVSEIQKLKAYTEREITPEDIENMVVADLDFQIYEMTNAIISKNANEALRIMKVLVGYGYKSTAIIGNLYSKYSMYLHISLNSSMSNDELGSYLGMKGGAVYYARPIAEKYSQVKLKKCVDYLHALQIDIVSGKRNEDSAVQEAVLAMINSGER